MLTREQVSLLRHAAIIIAAWLGFLLLAQWAPQPGEGRVAAQSDAGSETVAAP